MAQEKREKAIDLSHHLSELSKKRQTSPLKGLAKYFGRPGLISLAGGATTFIPSDLLRMAEMFARHAQRGLLPVREHWRRRYAIMWKLLELNLMTCPAALIPESFAVKADEQESSVSWFWKLFGKPKERTNPITVPKFPTKPDEINLAVALQYGMSTGLPQLQKFIDEFIAKVYQPAYSNCESLVQTGNTDGWSRAMQTLCNPGEMILTEDWTYPSALASARPFGIEPVPVPMDKEGMKSDELRKVLAEWDEKARGAKRSVQT